MPLLLQVMSSMVPTSSAQRVRLPYGMRNRRLLHTLIVPTLALLATSGCTTSDTTPPVEAPTCDADVCVDRDALGTPFIYAETLPAAAYGLGYSQAEDHASAIVTAHLKATGRLAEFTGPEAVNSDFLIHALHIPQRSNQLYLELPADVRDYLEAFAAGVNGYLDEHRSNEHLAWIGDYRATGEAAFALKRLEVIASQYSVASSDIKRFKPDPDDYKDATCPGYEYRDDSDKASNAWAVGAPLTPNGETILAGDPHLPWDLDPTDGANDGYFAYEAHFMVAGERFGGTTRLGVPALGPGYTERLAWSGTHSGADIADAYHLDIVDLQELSYRFGEETHKVELGTVTVEVEGAAAVSFTTADSVFGPVMCLQGSKISTCTGSFDHAFGLVLPSIDAMGLIETQYRLLAAQTAQDAIDLLRDQQIDEGNLVLASRDGDIVYHLGARIPKRNPDDTVCYAWPNPSSEPKTLPSFDEGGKLVIAPFDEHPLVINPASGYLVNNNVAPQLTSAGIDADELGWHNGLFPRGAAFNPDKGGQRQRQARSFFDSAAPGSVDATASMALAMDTEVYVWRYFKPLLETLVAKRPEVIADATSKAAVDAMLDWDGVVSKEARAVLVFLGWAARLDAMGYPFTTNNTGSWIDQPSDEVLDDAAKALIDPEQGAIAYRAGEGLQGVQGAEGALVAWGEVHYLQLPGSEVRRPLASGDRFLQTLLMSNASLDYPDHGMGATSAGSSVMLHVTFKPELDVRLVKPVGDLSDPDDPRYGNMSDLFAAGEYRTIVLEGPTAQARLFTTE